MPAMPLYVVESSSHQIVEPGVKTPHGAVGQGGGGEKVYLHVLELDDRTVASLRPRVTSRCVLDASGVPRPAPITEDELAQLRKVGALK